MVRNLNYYIIKTEDGYDFYEYPNKLIEHMEFIGSDLKEVKVYKSVEGAKKKCGRNHKKRTDLYMIGYGKARRYLLTALIHICLIGHHSKLHSRLA